MSKAFRRLRTVTAIQEPRLTLDGCAALRHQPGLYHHVFGKTGTSKAISVPARSGTGASHTKSCTYAAKEGMCFSASQDVPIRDLTTSSQMLRELLDTGCWHEVFVPAKTTPASTEGFHFRNLYSESTQDLLHEGSVRLTFLDIPDMHLVVFDICIIT